MLTGRLSGSRTQAVIPRRDQARRLALSSLAKAFKIAKAHLKRDLVSARAINWGNDRFARGAYSYVTLETRKIQSLLRSSNSDDVFFSGEALYSGRDVGTVEAALASGLETARTLAAARQRFDAAPKMRGRAGLGVKRRPARSPAPRGVMSAMGHERPTSWPARMSAFHPKRSFKDSLPTDQPRCQPRITGAALGQA